MQTETKLNIYELLLLEPEEANKMLLKESREVNPDIQVIEDILAYTLVDVNARNEDGWTALMWAAHMGNEKVVELLLNHPGIDVNLQNESGWTALMYGAFWGKEKSVELLLNHPGIDDNLRRNDGQIALVIAADQKKTKCVELIKQHIKNKEEAIRSLIRAELQYKYL
jgi:ankyrin repeat protein